MDNRHHWQDVTVGSLLGLFLSFFAYRQYYPALSSQNAHNPFEPRYMRGAVSGPFAGTALDEDAGPTTISPVNNGNGRGGNREYFDGVGDVEGRGT